MKKTAIMFLMACIALSALQAQVQAAGEWDPSADSIEGGRSTIEMTTLQIDGKTAYRFVGSIPAEGVGIAWPWAGADFKPDQATTDAFKSAKSISFMVRGNGGQYTARYHVNNVNDWAWHGYTFAAPAQATRIEIPMAAFMQPSWGRMVRLQTNRFTQFSIVPVGYNINYDITIWDLQINQ